MTVTGKLYIVGTPIGNLRDFSPRAIAVLQEVDRVAAEDTRVTGRLLNAFDITAPLTSFHEHNTQERLPFLMTELEAGKSLALVSDAGMPCISDPGAALVAACHCAGIPVETVPGPSAVTTALAASGFRTAHFYFAGFLAADKKRRRADLACLKNLSGLLLVLYEAPHRLRRTLADLAQLGWSDRPLCLAREMTKLHEEFLNLTVSEAIDKYKNQEPRGEYVLVLDLNEGGGELVIPAEDAATLGEHLTGRAGEQAFLAAGGGLSEPGLTALVTADLLAGRRVKEIVKRLLDRADPAENLSKNQLYEKVQAIKDLLVTEHLIEQVEK